MKIADAYIQLHPDMSNFGAELAALAPGYTLREEIEHERDDDGAIIRTVRTITLTLTEPPQSPRVEIRSDGFATWDGQVTTTVAQKTAEELRKLDREMR